MQTFVILNKKHTVVVKLLLQQTPHRKKCIHILYVHALETISTDICNIIIIQN